MKNTLSQATQAQKSEEVNFSRWLRSSFGREEPTRRAEQTHIFCPQIFCPKDNPNQREKFTSSRSPLALAAALLCFCLAAPQAAPVAPAMTLSRLLQKHRDAAATPAAQKDKTPHEIVYDISAGGLAGTMTATDAPPKRSRMELRLGPISVTTGTNGQTAWEQDGTGHVRILGGEELAERTADAAFSLEDYDPAKNGAAVTVKLRPGLDPETGCYMLDAKPNNGSLQTFYIDPKTFLIKKTLQHEGGMTGTSTVLAYTVQDGTEVPQSMAIQFAGLPLVVTATLKSVTRLPNASGALFAPPTSDGKDWQFLASGPQTSASIPFTTESGEIIVPVTLNGHPLRFLLDSGASEAFVTEAAAQTAALTTQGDLPALGYGGSAATSLAADTTLDVGGAVRLSHLTMHVIKNPAITRLLNQNGHLDGAIGYELFSRLSVGIDYAGKILTFTDPAAPAAAPVAGSVSVPLKLESRTPTVMASVDGRTPGRFLVDTGDSGTVHVYSQYAAANHLLPAPNAPGTTTQQSYGVGGTLTATLSPGHTLRVGSAQVSGLTLSTMTGPGIAQISTEAGGIGNLFLSRFTVLFEYAQSRLTLTPTTTAPAPAVPASGAAGMTLETLLQKHLAALGGEGALTAIKNTKITSEVQTGGISGTITTVYAAPDKEFEEDKLGILDNTQGYDGTLAWQRDTNGNVRPLAGEELKDMRVQLFFDTNSYVLPGRIPGKLTLRPQTEAGTGNYIVDTLPEGGKQSTIFFDPKTFMIVKEQHLDDDVLVMTNYTDYRTVDGTQFPFHTVSTNGTTRYDIIGTVTKLENNVDLPPGLFSEPAGGKNFGFVKPGATSATVPFDLDDGEIGLEVKLNGTPERVFLDSGAGGIALAQSAATSLGLKSSGFLEVRGYGGSTDQHPILIDKLEVPGAVQLTNVAAIAVALPEQLDDYFSRPLAGFLGYDLLSHFVVRIDYGRKKMTFTQADAFHPAAADGRALPLNLDSNLPTINARLDHLPPSQFLIDTGDADAAVRLYGPYVAAHGLGRKYPHGAETVGGGIGGVSRSRRTRIGAFTVAGITFQSLPADFSLDPKGGASLVNAGSLGSRLLSRFVVTFDYPHNRVFFARTAGTKSAFVTRTTGVTLMATTDKSGRTHLAVADILPGAPALKAGLSDFDEVISIDGRPAGRIGLDGARRLLSAPPVLHHTLVVQSVVGKPRTVAVTGFDPLVN